MSQIQTTDPNITQVEQHDQTKPPVLTVGKVTPQVLRDWEDACLGYYFHKGVADDRQVRSVILGLKDFCIGDWYRAAKTAVDNLTFDELMEQLRARLLKDGWQHGLQKEILSSKQGSLRFNDWQNKMGATNSLLVGTTFHITTTALRDHLAANMHHDLANECDDNNAHEIVAFQE